MNIIPLVFAPIITTGAFLGHEYEGNLSYLNARYMSHSTSRFITQDRAKQYASQYSYGAGDVIAHSDPTGMMWGDLIELTDMTGQEEKRSLITAELTTKVSDAKPSVRQSNSNSIVMGSRQSDNFNIKNQELEGRQNTLDRHQFTLHKEKMELDYRQNELNRQQAKLDQERIDLEKHIRISKGNHRVTQRVVSEFDPLTYLENEVSNINVRLDVLSKQYGVKMGNLKAMNRRMDQNIKSILFEYDNDDDEFQDFQQYKD